MDKGRMLILCLAAVLMTSYGATVPEEKSDGDRLKRSGDLTGYIGSKIGSSISAFASASGSLSSSSKHEHHEEHESKSLDFWTFKKALLNTLLQAVKAIKGGIIAVKGQIVKAKGHLLTTKGRMISAKGEALSNFGKHVASMALHLDKPKHPSPHEHHPPPHEHHPPPPAHHPPPPAHHHPPSAHHPPPSFNHHSGHSAGFSSAPSGTSSGFGGSFSGYGVPPPVSDSYGAPVHPSGLYGAPFKLTARGSSGNTQSTDKSSSLPAGTHAGLLVIKPIPPASGSARAASHTSNLHDFFADSSQPVASLVPAPFRRSDSSSYITSPEDYSFMPEFSDPYSL